MLIRPYALLALALSFTPALVQATEPAAAAETATPQAAASPTPSSRESAALRDAEAGMKAWLELIDTEKYLDSWKTASLPFQKSINAGRWAMSCRNQRKPTGKFIRRTLEEKHYHTEHYTADGHLEKGEIVTFIFLSEYEHLKQATEVVILRPFGAEWKVVSYRLKPKFT